MNPRVRPAVLAATAAMLLACSAGAGVAAAEVHHLNCSAIEAGSGSAESPLNTLGAANAVMLGPGDRLLIKRGTTCTGLLAPQGSGSPESPIVVGAYGWGPKPRIVGTGPDVLLISDSSNLIAQDLDVSNPGDAPPLGEFTSIRRGIQVVAAADTVSNVTIRWMSVHDIAGDLNKDINGSAGIQISATGAPPVRFDDLLIEHNRINYVSRSGISIFGTNDPNRPASAKDSWPNASMGVVVRGNRIDQIAGDGIVPRGTDGAIVEDNVVSHGNLSGREIFDPRGSVCNAGIWTFHSINTLIQRNEVFGMEFNGCDGTGYDIDYRQDGTVIQFNYSHNNEGGFVLLCSANDIHSAEVRFNLSVNDGTTINEAPCKIDEGVIGTLDGMRFYNNTVVAPRPGTTLELTPLEAMIAPGSFEFRNNLIYGTTSRTTPMPCGDNCSNNLFHNLPPSGLAAITSNPRLLNPKKHGPGRLRVGGGFKLGRRSPARKAGVRVGGTPSRDFFGHKWATKKRPSIGLDQSARIKKRRHR